MAVKVDFTALETQVENTVTVEGGAAKLINGFADAVDAANTEANAKITAVTTAMRSSADTLAAAVLANTPSA